MLRPSKRSSDQLRQVTFSRHYTKHAEGSVLVEFGDTQVICTASITPGVPPFLKNSGQGWLTAEYGMLPRSTQERMAREASKGKQSGRTQEIQRLIGRALRSCVNLKTLGEYTITVDCDVIQADGGTRTAAISGGCLAVIDALACLKKRILANSASSQDHAVLTTFLLKRVAAVSVGIYQGQAILDLDYSEDSQAETDMNIVMNEAGEFIEIQGTAEAQSFSEQELQQMLQLAKQGIGELLKKQQQALSS